MVDTGVGLGPPECWDSHSYRVRVIKVALVASSVG